MRLVEINSSLSGDRCNETLLERTLTAFHDFTFVRNFLEHLQLAVRVRSELGVVNRRLASNLLLWQTQSGDVDVICRSSLLFFVEVSACEKMSELKIGIIGVALRSGSRDLLLGSWEPLDRVTCRFHRILDENIEDKRGFVHQIFLGHGFVAVIVSFHLINYNGVFRINIESVAIRSAERLREVRPQRERIPRQDRVQVRVHLCNWTQTFEK